MDAVYLTPSQLSKRWGGAVTTGTLANWRCKGAGPSYAKLGERVLYPLANVEAYEAEHMRPVSPANDNAGAAGEGAAA